MTTNRKLQIKFTITTMLAVTIIVIGVFTVVTLENYQMTNKQLDTLLNLISENDGLIPEVPKDDEFLADEAKYSTRYFTIRVDSEGKITELNLEHIASISHEQARDMTKKILKSSKNIGIFHNIANSILENNREYGFFSNYKYKITNINDEKLIVFIDCQMQLQSFKIATLRSIAVTGRFTFSNFIGCCSCFKNYFKSCI